MLAKVDSSNKLMVFVESTRLWANVDSTCMQVLGKFDTEKVHAFIDDYVQP